MKEGPEVGKYPDKMMRSGDGKAKLDRERAAKQKERQGDADHESDSRDKGERDPSGD